MPWENVLLTIFKITFLPVSKKKRKKGEERKMKSKIKYK